MVLCLAFLFFCEAHSKYLPGGNDRLTLIMVFNYQCPNSLFAFFPEDVYSKTSSSDVLPQLLGCLPVDKVQAVQFLRGGIVRLTFQDESTRNEVLVRGISFQGTQLRVVCAMSEVRSLFVCDLPVEVPDDVVSSFLASFGDVVHVTRSTYKDFPSVCDGNRIVRIVLKKDVPYFVRMADCNCRVWYARQPVQCVICRESGHVGRDCPLSGRCRCYHQPGHVARLCTQAWGPSRSAVVSATADAVQSTIDEDGGDGNEIDDAGADAPPSSPSRPRVSPSQPRVLHAGDKNDGAGDGIPPASPSRPRVPDVAPQPPNASVPPIETVKSPVSPGKPTSRLSLKLQLLRTTADSNPILRDLLSVIGHVVTEGLLDQIRCPMHTNKFKVCLIDLAMERLDLKTQNIVKSRFGRFVL